MERAYLRYENENEGEDDEEKEVMDSSRQLTLLELQKHTRMRTPTRPPPQSQTPPKHLSFSQQTQHHQKQNNSIQLPAPSPSPSLHQNKKKREPGYSSVPPAAITSLLDTIRNHIQTSRYGFIELIRSFRKLSDTPSDDEVDLHDFKRCIKELNVPCMTDISIRLIFDNFDVNSSGLILVGDFIDSIRNELSFGRAALVNSAFNVINGSENDSVSPCDMVECYDTSSSNIREFLSSFDVDASDVNDGMISRTDFLEYYRNVYISSEDVFKRLMVNTWGINPNSTSNSTTPTLTPVPQQRTGDGLGPLYKPARDQRLASCSTIPGILPGTGRNEEPSDMNKSWRFKFRGGKRDGRVPVGVGVTVGKVVGELGRNGVSSYGDVRDVFKDAEDGEDGNGGETIDLSTLTKVLKSIRGDLELSDIRRLFEYFDYNRTDCIYLADVINAFSTTTNDDSSSNQNRKRNSATSTVKKVEVNEHRAKIIKQVFKTLDVNRNGVIDPSYIIQTFKSNLSSSSSNNNNNIPSSSKDRDRDEVLSDFVHDFQVGGEVDGMVTYVDFESYCGKIGVGIDSDFDFETLLKKTWAVKKQPSSSSSLEQSQSLSSLTNKIKTQKLDPSTVQATSGTVNTSRRAFGSVAGSTVMDALHNTQQEQHAGNHNSTAITSTSRSRGRGRGKVNEPDFVVQTLLKTLYKQIRGNGVCGMIALTLAFKHTNAGSGSGSDEISFGDFKKCINSVCSSTPTANANVMMMRDKDLSAIFNHFDDEAVNTNVGVISYVHFVDSLRSTLGMQLDLLRNERRMRLIEIAYRKIDTCRSTHNVNDSDGGATLPLNLNLIMGTFQCNRHPDVMCGLKSPQKVFSDFLMYFDSSKGVVNREEFKEYYLDLSSCVVNCDYFELVISNTWRLIDDYDDGYGYDDENYDYNEDMLNPDYRSPNNTTNETNNETTNNKSFKAKQTMLTSQINFSNGHANDDVAHQRLLGMSSKKSARGSEVLRDSHLGLGFIEKKFSGEKANKANSTMHDLNSNNSSGNYRGAGAGMRSLSSYSSSSTSKPNTNEVIQKIRTELVGRGVRGIPSFTRALRADADADPTKIKTTSLQKFVSVIKKLDLDSILTSDEVTEVFEYFFDGNGNGTTDSTKCEDFINAVRGALNRRRSNLITLAFRSLDADKKGSITANVLMDKYKPNLHPETLNGRKSADDVMREFLDTFDISSSSNGSVRLSEFREYYTNVSVGIVDDLYFEGMVEGTWDLAPSNSSINTGGVMRVNCILQNGTAKVIGITSTRGLKIGDKMEAMVRLKLQGEHDVRSLTFFEVPSSSNANKVNGKFNNSTISLAHGGSNGDGDKGSGRSVRKMVNRTYVSSFKLDY